MKLTTSFLVLSSVFALGLAAPHNARLEERQRDVTYTITCLGPLCTDYPPTTVRLPTSIAIPSFPGNPDPEPTTTIKSTPKTTAAPTSKKTTTSKYTPPPSTSKYTPPPSTSKYTPPPATSKYTPPPITSKYTPPPTRTSVKSTAKPTKTTGQPAGPSSTKCPVPLYYQCGGFYDGKPWTGCEVCVPGANCAWQNDYYMQCVEDV